MSDHSPSNQRSPLQELREIVENQAAGRPFLPVEMALLRRVVAAHEPPASYPVILREPTEEMMQAGLYQASHDSTSADVRSIWVDMWDKAAGAALPPTAARPINEWHEEIGDVVWWKFPMDEPAYIGSPLSSDWPGYHTHWTPHPTLPCTSETKPDRCDDYPSCITCGPEAAATKEDCRACKGSGKIPTGTPGERVACDCPAGETSGGQS